MRALVMSLYWMVRKLLQKTPSQILSRLIYAYRWYSFDVWKNVLARRPIEEILLREFIPQKNRSTQIWGEKHITESRTHLAERLCRYYSGVDPGFHVASDAFELNTLLLSAGDVSSTVRMADDVLKNRFSFRSTSHDFGPSIEWDFSASGYRDWNRDLNRLFYLSDLGRAYVYTGEKKYIGKILNIVEDWADQNPISRGNKNWNDVLEVAIRVGALCWAWFYVLGAVIRQEVAPVRAFSIVKLIWQHANYLNRFIEVHNWGNHLLLESKSLILVGLLFPEFKSAGKWSDRGWHFLKQELGKQVRADGVHAEQASMYHKIISSELSELYVLLRRKSKPIPEWFFGRLQSMLEVEMHLTKPDGSFPVWGDSSLSDLLLRYQALGVGAALCERPDFKYLVDELLGGLDEHTRWLLGSQGVKSYETVSARAPREVSKSFADGGIYVMRSKWTPDADCLMLDGGPFGHRLAPAHGHADALSIDLSYRGAAYIVDSGTFDYTLTPEWRSYFRGTAGHNTVRVNASDQTLLRGLFDAYELAQIEQHAWVSTDSFDFADVSHSGYKRRFGVVHRRQVLFLKSSVWIIRDRLEGAGRQSLEWFWHFVPGAEVILRKGATACDVRRAEHNQTLSLFWFPMAGLNAEVVEGQADPVLGWVSERFGTRTSAPVLRINGTLELPVEFVTVILGQSSLGARGEVELSCDDETKRSIVKVRSPNGDCLVNFSDFSVRINEREFALLTSSHFSTSV
jgi:hypothetical protein